MRFNCKYNYHKIDFRTAKYFLLRWLLSTALLTSLPLSACLVDSDALYTPVITPVLPVTVVVLPTTTPCPTATRLPTPTPAIEVYLHQGAVYLHDKEWDEAAQAYRQAAELDPDSFEIRSVLGYIYAQQGKYELAEPEFLKAHELRPDDYHTLKNLALIYDNMERYGTALEYAQQALELAPEEDRAAMEKFVQYLRARQE